MAQQWASGSRHGCATHLFIFAILSGDVSSAKITSISMISKRWWLAQKMEMTEGEKKQEEGVWEKKKKVA